MEGIIELTNHPETGKIKCRTVANVVVDTFLRHNLRHTVPDNLGRIDKGGKSYVRGKNEIQ